MTGLSEPTAGARIAGVLETCLYAADLPAVVRFYERVLGLRVISSEEGRHVFFRVGKGMLLLFDPSRTEQSVSGVPPHGSRGPGHVAFAVHSHSLGEWRARLRDLGIPVESEVAWPRGGISLYIRDPAGNSVELTSPGIWGISEDDVLGGSPTGE